VDSYLNENNIALYGSCPPLFVYYICFQASVCTLSLAMAAHLRYTCKQEAKLSLG